MSVTGWLQLHRRSILFLLAILTLAGLSASLRLPVTLFPNVDFPRVVVTLDAGDRPADMMMVMVTRPVEEAVRLVPGVRNVRSTTSRGEAEISVSFDWGMDMALATVQLGQAITQVLPQLPSGTQMTVRRMDPTVFPILAYSLTASSLSQSQLYDLAQYQLRPLLSSVNGVSRVEVQGGEREEYEVEVDPARLAAWGLTPGDVVQAVTAGNVVDAVGRLEDHYKLYLAVADTRLQTVQQLRDMPVRTPGGAVIPLGKLARVSDGVAPHWTRVNADGRQAVLLNIFQQPGGNSVQIAHDVATRLAGYRSQMPAGVHLSNWYDQSVLVTDSARSVRDAMLTGTGLAILVLWLFLRNLRITFIALVIVPVVLASTVLVLYVTGMSFNIMTLGGMAAAVGLIIDDAIVMTEHIVRRLRGTTGAQHERILQAAAEFVRPLAGSSAATIIIFVPLAFLTGVTGAYFKALSLTMAAGLLISFFVTWMGAPVLAEQLLRGRDAGEDGRFTHLLQLRYDAFMRRLLARPLWLLLVLAPLVMGGTLAFVNLGSGFMPSMDEGGFTLDYLSTPGTSLTETDRLLRQVETILKTDPDVQTYSRRTGAQLGGGITEANEGDFFVRLRNGQRAPIDVVMDRIRTRIEHEVPGLDIELAQLMEDEIGDLTAVPQPIEIKIFGDDARALLQTAQRMQQRIGRIPGVVDTRDGIHPAGDALEIHIDRALAALEGMTPDGITQAVATDLGGMVATSIQHGPKLIGVRVWMPQGLRQRDRDVSRLMLRAPDGHLFPLGRVAKVEAVSGQAQIVRENLKRMVAVTGRISGRSMGAVMADVRRAIAAPGNLPSGMYVELGGLYEQQQIAFRGLVVVFVAAIGLVFLLLLLLYERFSVVLSILLMPLLSVFAVFAGLQLSGMELDISSMMGMTMIVGIVTEAAIFYFSEFFDLEKTTDLHARLVMAGRNRMRPIAMTGFAAMLTLMPLALALGRGASMQQPLAVAVVSGLAVQPVLVLIVMPVLYSILAGRKHFDDGAEHVETDYQHR